MQCSQNPPAFRNSSPVAFSNLLEAESDWDRCRKTTGTIKFIAPLPKWETEKPFNLAFPFPPNQPKTNSEYNSHAVQISDGRGKEDSFSLDVHGFAFARLPYGETALQSNETIENEYLPQMEALLKQQLGAERVLAFDYALREVKRPGHGGYRWHEKRPPARNAHTDQTPEAAMSRLRLYFKDEVGTLINKRVRFIK
ncbi:hypothetical protein GGR53DRAFT_329976 [Hypoxylon sp. FL1150]|nr:hypothetical protein GGR53DRAFT_329976 [Hypoxylon sp. FL1150]